MKFKLSLLLIIINCNLETKGSDPTMDYNSLKGSGISPQEYDALVQDRQLQYLNNKIKDV